MENKEEKKFTYEELSDICSKLVEQNNQLMARINEINNINLFRRLDYLFKVVENDNKFPKEFVDSCVNELVFGLTIPEEASKEEKSE